jgi:hypothetical protein
MPKKTKPPTNTNEPNTALTITWRNQLQRDSGNQRRAANWAKTTQKNATPHAGAKKLSK